jgi:hypothetical protein
LVVICLPLLRWHVNLTFLAAAECPEYAIGGSQQGGSTRRGRVVVVAIVFLSLLRAAAVGCCMFLPSSIAKGNFRSTSIRSTLASSSPTLFSGFIVAAAAAAMASRTAAATKGPKKGTTYAPRIAPGLPLAAAARSATAPSAETKTSTSRKPRLVFHWFRNDLRLHDNPALSHSVASSEVCVPVYVFDPKWFGDGARTRWGTPKWGPRRAKFLLESVQDLRRRLEGLSPSSSSPSSSKGGVGLVVAHGNVGDVFERLVASVKGSYDVSW